MLLEGGVAVSECVTGMPLLSKNDYRRYCQHSVDM